MGKYFINRIIFLFVFCAAATVYAAQPAPGQAAPDFRLQDQNNKWHTLNNFRGNWIALYFYPKADTPGCTTESCAFRDDIFKFKKLGVRVVGVSLDDVSSQKEFADKYHLPFPLLSDSKKTVAQAYGVLGDYRGSKIAKRQTFIIDPEGRIAKHYKKVNPETHSEQVLEDIRELLARAPKGNVTDL